MSSSTMKAYVVGTANVLVVAFAFGVAQGDTPTQVFGLFLGMSFAGIFLAAVPIAVIGRVAGSIRRARLPILMGLSFATVAGLGLCMTVMLVGGNDDDIFLSLIPLACMPTAAAAAILERWTRPAPLITSARALSGTGSGSPESHPSRTASCT